MFTVSPVVEESLEVFQLIMQEPQLARQRVDLDSQEHNACRGTLGFMLRDWYA